MIEKRSLMEAPELRGDGSARTLAGYAAVFNSPAPIGDAFEEIVMPGAFTETLKRSDVRALFDHDSGRLLGRASNGTLRLKEDKRGLAVEIDLPDTSDGRDIGELVKRGDLDGMSFGFSVTHDEWDETKTPQVRRIHAVELFEVSAVTFPAYVDTALALRSREAATSKADDEKSKALHNRQQAMARIAARRMDAEQKFRRIAGE